METWTSSHDDSNNICSESLHGKKSLEKEYSLSQNLVDPVTFFSKLWCFLVEFHFPYSNTAQLFESKHRNNDHTKDNKEAENDDDV